MAGEVGEIAVRVGADISSLKRGMSEGSASVGSFSSSSRAGLNKVAGSIFKVGAAAAAAGSAIAVHLVNDARAAIDAQAKLAKQIGSTSAEVATLTRAGDLSGVSLSNITNASLKLSINAGKAEQGLMAQKRSFDAMGLSAAEVMKLPLSERFLKINEAINKNVDASQRAAVASDVFGAKNASLIALLDPATISQAAKETEIFGLNLSDVDASKVEMANDALSTIGKALDGISQQITVQIAPILRVVGQTFVDSAEEAGGFEGAVDSAFTALIDGAAFAMNAFDGIKRIVRIVADAIIGSFSLAIGKVLGGIDMVLEGWKLIAEVTGADVAAGAIESIQEFGRQSLAVADEAAKNIDEVLSAPMAGDQFKQFVENAKQAGQAAAEAAVQARDAVVGGNVVSMDSGRSEQEIKAINARIEAIRVANATELELLNEKYAAEVEAMTLALEAKQITQDQAYALSLGAADRYASGKLSIEQAAADKEVALNKKKEDAKRAILSQAFGGLTSLMNSESRKMFEIGKAAAISQAVVSTYSGMAKALELGWPLGPIAAGAIALNGFGQVANIRKQSFGGGGAASATGSTTGQINAATTQTGGGGGASEPRQVVNVALNGQFFSRDMVRDMIPMIGEELQDGGVLGSVA